MEDASYVIMRSGVFQTRSTRDTFIDKKVPPNVLLNVILKIL